MPLGARWRAAMDQPWFMPVLVLLVAVRFVSASVTAFAAIEGLDIRGLEAGFEIYSDVLLIALVVVVCLWLVEWVESLRTRPAFLLVAVLSGAVVVQWVGTVEPALRVFSGDLGPWADFLLGVTVAGAVGSVTIVLDTILQRKAASHTALTGLRALGFGFAVAILLRAIRLLDADFLFGWHMPSGVVWVLDFGPSLLLTGLAVAAWAWVTRRHSVSWRSRMLSLAIPVVGAGIGFAAALGLGGFIASNALAWGGSYTVFAPTTASLSIVGFGLGAFLSTTLAAGRTIPRTAARLIFGGVAVAALAGIQTSAGILVSFVGIVTGIVSAARGVSDLVADAS